MEEALSFLAAMIAMANPVFQVPIWMQATQGERPAVRRRLAFLVCATAAIVLVAALLLGVPVLEFFHINLFAFRIGGGLILIHLGLRMLDGVAVRVDESHEEGDSAGIAARRKFESIATPIAVPLIAGPGAISTCVIYGAGIDSFVQQLLFVGVVVFTISIIFVFLAFGDRITHIVGPTFFRILPRVFAIVLLAIGVQFILEGLGNAFPGWPQP